ncbi:hypothetical protein HJC99_06825 [Candidatus Saccharibacteria bacterium]|nr:hypothetical protein [Candidatus Saccharibacteria bacterium]
MELRRQLRVQAFLLVTAALALLTTAFGVLEAPSVQAAQTIPYKINFQGRLTDNNGNALTDGYYNIKFRLWTAASGGSNVWEADRVDGASDFRVQVVGGLFNIQFGDTSLGDPALSPTLFSGSFPLYLEVELPTPATATCATNGCASFTEGAMTPRQTLASAAYAFNSDTLDGLDSTAFAQLASANTYTAANLFAPTAGSTVALTVAASTAGGSNSLNVKDSGGALQAYFDASGSLNVAQAIQPTTNGGTDVGTAAKAFGSLYATNLDTGTSGTTLSVGGTNATTITIGGSVATQALNAGSLASGSVTTLTGAGITTTLASGGVLIQPSTDNPSVFQVAKAGGSPMFNVDTQNGRVGIGTATPAEVLDVAGAVKLGTTTNANAGTIRFTGADFQGYNGSSWVALNAAATNVIANQMQQVIKPTDQIVTSSAAFVNDNALSFTVGPNETWTYNMTVFGNSGTTPDFKFSMSAPAGSSCVWGVSEAENADSNGNLSCGASSGLISGSGADEPYYITGTVTAGVTGGSVTLQWAQNTANAANTIVRAGSYLQAMQQSAGSLNPFVQGGNSFGATGVLGTADNNDLSIVANGTEGLHINTMGNVGVGGVSSGGAKLDVNGDVAMRGMGAPAVSPIGQGRLYFDSSTNHFRVSENGNSFVDLLGTGANTALSNLVGVDINTSLTTTTSNTIDVGSSANTFRSGYFGTTLEAPTLAAANNTDLSLQSTGTGNLNLLSGSGLLNLTATTIRTTSQPSLTFDLNSAINSTLYVQNSNAGHVANLDVSGSLNVGAGQQISVGGSQISSSDLSDGSSITKQGNSFNGVTQLVQTDGSGALPAISGGNLTNLDPSNLAVGSGAVTLQSAASSALTLTSGTGTINIGSSILQSVGSALTIDLATAGTSQLSLINSSGSNTANLSISGGVTLGSGQSVTVGSSTGTGVTCTSGNVLQNQVVVGGIVTGGTCAPGGGITTLQDAYDNSASPATITTSAATKDVVIQSGSGFNSTTALQVIPDGSSTATFNVDTQNNRVGIGTNAPSYMLDIAGTVNAAGNYYSGGTAGVARTCSGGQILQNPVVSGGIVTGGTCATGGGGGGGSSQIGAMVAQVYDAAGGTDANSATPTAIPWNAQTRVDSGYTHSTSVNPTRLNIVNNGWYQVSYSVSTANASANRNTVQCRLRFNGTTYNTPSSSYSYTRNTVDANGTNSTSVMVQATAGDYIEVVCNLSGSAGAGPTIAGQSWLQIQSLDGASPFSVNTGVITQTNATDRLQLNIGQTGDAGLEIQGISGQTSNFFEIRNQSGSTNPVFAVDVNHKLQFGAGGVSALDTNLYRSAAGILKTDGQLQIGTLATATATPVCIDGTGALASCSSTWGVSDLQGAYDGSTSPQITLGASGALTIRDNAAPLGGDLLAVQNNAGTINYLAVTASGLSTSGSINVAAGQTYQINGTPLASSDLSDGLSITKQGNSFNGTSQLVQTDATGALPAVSGSNLTNLDASAVATGSGAVSLASGGTSGLSLTSASGTIGLGSAILQRTANAMTIDLTTAGTSTLTVGNSNGANVANLAVTGSLGIGTGGAFSVGASSGGNITCTGGQFFQNQIITGGIVTGGTCAGATATDLQTAYDTSTSPATINLNASAKDFVINATDQATDPNILFNLQCTTCSAGAGRLAIQNSGTDVFTVNPVGSIVVTPTTSQDLTVNLAAGSTASFAATAAPTSDLVSISNAGQATTAANANGLSINYVGGNANVESSAARFDLTPGTNTSGGTWSGLRIVANATGTANSNINEYGIKLDGPSSPGSGTEVGLVIGTGWDAGLDIAATPNNPTAPSSGTLRLYTKSIAGRTMLKAIGSSGVDYPYQPAFFQQAISMQSPSNGATVNSVGSLWSVDTTASTPAVSEQYGFATNFATAATANDTTGVGNTAVQFYRGSTPGANGFFYEARTAYPDANYGSGATGSRIWEGLTNQTIATNTSADNPAGHYAGFQYSTTRGDTNWQFMTKDGTTQNVIDTTEAFVVGKVYEFYIYTPPQGTTIYWRVDNLTDGTTQEGSTVSNLPGASTAMRGGSGLRTLTTTSRNMRVMRHYVEADR